MMPDPLQLAHAREFPAEVAALLAQQDRAEAAAFLLECPPEVAAAVTAALPSSLAQYALAETDDKRISAMFDAADFETAVFLLSRARLETRQELINLVSSKRRRRLLAARFVFPDNSLGAVASRDFIAVPLGSTLRDVVKELHAENIEAGEAPPIYILGDGGRLHGALDLYRSLETEDLDLQVEHCLTGVEPLPGDMPLESALLSPRWKGATVVPVVDRKNHLLGSVTLQQIQEASQPFIGQEDANVVVDLSRRYFEVLGGLTDLTLGRRDRR